MKASRPCLDKLYRDFSGKLDDGLDHRHIYKMLHPVAMERKDRCQEFIEKFITNEILPKMRENNWNNPYMLHSKTQGRLFIETYG